MLDKAIDLLKMVREYIKNNKPLCPFPQRDLIYSVFLNNNGTLKEEFIEIFPIERTNNFYRVISIMGTAYGSSGNVPNDIVESMRGNINRHNLITAIDEIINELSKNNNDENKKEDRIKMNEYDVFISHANKDKEDLIEELYQSLNKLGIKIFYDKESLEWGDDWKDKIMNGTKKAEFAIIVISENFFDREWTERELKEFLNRQNRNGQKIILPILHNITIDELYNKYPTVADIQTIDSKEYTCDQMALMFAQQLIKRLKSIQK